MSGRNDHRGLVANWSDNIVQACVRAYDPLESLADDIEECTFEILAEEVRGNFNLECGAFKRNGPDGFEPGLELTRLNDLLDDAQTIVPNVNMFL